MAAEAYRRMDEHLVAHAQECYGWDQRSACLLHPGQKCAISSRRHDDEADSDEEDRPAPITECIGGAMCTPWSAFGRQLGLADPATKSWACWINEAATIPYDFVWFENSWLFPMQLFDQKLALKNHVIWVTAGPEHLGWPMRRRRVLAVAISRQSLVWVGPTTPQAVQCEFLDAIKARCVAQADLFINIDSAEQRRQQVRRMSQTRCVWFRPGQPVDYRSLLPRRSRDFWDENMELQRQSGSNDDCFIADLSQDPIERPRGSRSNTWLPAAMHSSEVFCLKPGPEKFTPGEMQFAHGWSLTSTSLGDKYRDCVSFGFEQLSHAEQRRLSGNGMHLPVVSAWMLFVKTHVLRIDVLQKLAPPRASERATTMIMMRMTGWTRS